MNILKAKEHDIGNLVVRRYLPGEKKMVGPFIFFDHFGPARFKQHQGIDVRPHPHAHLATVTYLFDGAILHRDSLGSTQLIEPGAINWMVAGRGIVHSERTPDALRQSGSQINGIQCWIALPDEYEDVAPSFTHYPAATLPRLSKSGADICLLAGKCFGAESPVKHFGDVIYADIRLHANGELLLASVAEEMAIYIVSGDVQVNNQSVAANQLVILPANSSNTLGSAQGAVIMLLGGKSVGERYIEWNFVGSTKEKIRQAKQDWRNGPSQDGGRFPVIPGDDKDFIPLPPEKDCGKDSGIM